MAGLRLVGLLLASYLETKGRRSVFNSANYRVEEKVSFSNIFWSSAGEKSHFTAQKSTRSIFGISASNQRRGALFLSPVRVSHLKKR